MRLVAGDQSDDPVAPLHVDGPDLLRPVLPEPAAFDHRRTTHADVGVGGRDDDVAGAGQRGVAGEAASGHDRYQRHLPAERAQRAEGRHVEAGHAGDVGVARPATAAFGEQHHRQAFCGRPTRRPGRFWRGCACPAYRPARCSRKTPRRPRRRPILATPATNPSAGVLAIRSSSERRLRCAAIASAPYSTKLPGSTRSAMFSRAVRRFWLCRLAIALGRPSSRVSRCRRRTSSRSARRRSRSSAATSSAPALAPVRVNTTTGSPVPIDLPGRHQSPDRAHRVRRDRAHVAFSSPRAPPVARLRRTRLLRPQPRSRCRPAAHAALPHPDTVPAARVGAHAARLRGDDEGGKVVVDKVGGDQAGVNIAVATALPAETRRWCGFLRYRIRPRPSAPCAPPRKTTIRVPG